VATSTEFFGAARRQPVAVDEPADGHHHLTASVAAGAIGGCLRHERDRCSGIGTGHTVATTSVAQPSRAR